MFVILLLNENKIDEILILVFVFSFLIGFITELIGVNTGFLFGDYVYGKILGIKFFNVPILIGLNWFTIVFSAYVISAKIINYLPTLFFKKNESSLLKIFSHSILCATIATSFDWLMEPVAMKLQFWSWKNNEIPVYNYISWFVISFLISSVFFKMKLAYTNRFAPVLLIIQSIFFLFLRIFLN